MIEKQSTGAATLLMNMLATIATSMLASNTVRGFVPALLSTNVAIRFATLYLDKAAAMVNPPNNSIITGVHMAANMKEAASFVLSLSCGFSSERTTLKITARNGTINDVTNNGIA